MKKFYVKYTVFHLLILIVIFLSSFVTNADTLTISVDHDETGTDAVDLCMPSIAQTGNFTRYVETTLRPKKWYELFGSGDLRDNFIFYNYSNVSATIKLTNIPTGTNYNLELYKDDQRIAQSVYSGTTNEYIYASLEPGFYRVSVYSKSGQSNSKYKLQTTIYKGSFITTSIDTAKANGAKAILWENHFIPFGFLPETYQGQLVGEMGGTHTGSYNTVPPMETHALGVNNPFLLRTLYVWDQSVKQQLYADVILLKGIMEAQVNLNSEVSFKFDVVNGTFEMVDLLITIAGVQIPGYPLVSIFFKLIMAGLQSARPVLVSDVLDYIDDLEIALEVSRHVEGQVIQIQQSVIMYPVSSWSNSGGGGITLGLGFYLMNVSGASFTYVSHTVSELPQGATVTGSNHTIYNISDLPSGILYSDLYI